MLSTSEVAGRLFCEGIMPGKDTEACNPYIFGKSSKCLHIIVESPCSLSSAPATNFQ
uniref:Uncharacterized protein n=1 Tax=Piliocolobus tephrosceles TaxID=591936 RepID=A0A8C9INY8_9PRIM